MRSVALVIVLVLFLQGIYAQPENYLNISIGDTIDVNYPPETRFVLEDNSGKMVLFYDQLLVLGEYEVRSQMTLYVFHEWKPGPDVWKINSGMIALLPLRSDIDEEMLTVDQVSAGVENPSGEVKVLRKHIIRNASGEKEVSLTFSNGIIFYLKDGQARAWFNGESLPIEGKYIVKSPSGELKLSFNPRTETIWYVFVVY